MHTFLKSQSEEKGETEKKDETESINNLSKNKQVPEYSYCETKINFFLPYNLIKPNNYSIQLLNKNQLI